MIRYLWAALAICGTLLVWSLRSGAKADERAHQAEMLADSLGRVREKLEATAKSDSTALELALNDAMEKEGQLEAQRAQALGKGAVAAHKADTASVALSQLLDSLGASHAALDQLNEAHAQEIAAKDTQIALADSSTAVEHSLRLATERALDSERKAHQASVQESGALRVEIGALKAGSHRDRLVGAVVVTGLILARITHVL